MRILILALLASLPGMVLAEASDTMYVKLTSNMVVNYGEPSINRLKYMKLAVHVRVPDAASADLVEYHMPALIDGLVQVLTSQEEAVVKSPTGKEEIRQHTLSRLKEVMKKEEGEEIIQDVLFAAFVVQR